MLKILENNFKKTFKPLDIIKISSNQTGSLSVIDGAGMEYFSILISDFAEFYVGSALGTHKIILKNTNNTIIDSLEFFVNCETTISGNGMINELFSLLEYSMKRGCEIDSVLLNKKIYSFFVPWVRDHVHVLKGMKYFEHNLKSAIEMYKDTQRFDGMIWDNIYYRDRDLSYFQQVFNEGDFISLSDDRRFELRRMPVEADVEYLYVEGIYQTWKASGDDGWMFEMLESAIKAMEYCISSPYRWSENFQLIKRTFTIDTWDFQSWVDTKNTDHFMTLDLDHTQFGIMHGDNTGFMNSCYYLSEMLRFIGNEVQAIRFEDLAQSIKTNLDKVSWNGDFFTHHVPENSDFKRDEALGAILNEQISLSNSYALNRGISHEQSIKIIQKYQSIKEVLPSGAVGEWYSIFPPFNNFDGKHASKWEYVNGGILTIVAGELAKGAFENGYENYAIDILQRINTIGKIHGGYLHCTYKGQISSRPETHFKPLNLSNHCNSDFYSDLNVVEAPELERYFESELLSKPIGKIEYDGVLFEVPDSARNSGNGCITLSNTCANHLTETYINVGSKATSIYIMHTMSGESPCGLLTLTYTDGTKHYRYINELKEKSDTTAEVQRWYQPVRGEYYGNYTSPNLRLVWHGKNDVCSRVGISAFALDNPFPEKEIASINLEAMKNGSYWYVFAITLSDQKAYFTPDDVSGGMPDAWGAAAVMSALIEGLSGVKDCGRAFSNVTLSPRWSYVSDQKVKVCVRYPASTGYISYFYSINDNKINLILTGNGSVSNCHILLPKEVKKVNYVACNNEILIHTILKIEDSYYVDFKLPNNYSIAQVVIDINP